MFFEKPSLASLVFRHLCIASIGGVEPKSMKWQEIHVCKKCPEKTTFFLSSKYVVNANYKRFTANEVPVSRGILVAQQRAIRFCVSLDCGEYS